MNNLASVSWPAERVSETIEALARQSNLSMKPVEMPLPSNGLNERDDETIGRWVEAIAAKVGLEAEPKWIRYADVGDLVRGAGPALVRLPGQGQVRFLAVLGGGRRSVTILGPDLKVHRLRLEVIRSALYQEVEAPVVAETDKLIEEVGVPRRRRSRARTAILRERLGPVRVGGCWLLRLPPSASVWGQARRAHLPSRFLVFIGAYTVQYVLWLLAWWVIGKGAFQGHLDQGWLLAWALLLLTLIPFRLIATWTQGRLAVGAGGLLKRRLLHGALRLEPDEIRHKGAGQFLGQVLESQAVEFLALSGGFLGLAAVIELLLAAVVLGAGAGGWIHVLLLLSWLAVTLLLGWEHFRQRRQWTEVRLLMTHDLIDRMVGHRTRLVQEVGEHWHDAEDQTLERYLDVSRSTDRVTTLVRALIPRGWLILGLFGLALVFVAGDASPAAIAVGLGGILLAYRALMKLSEGLLQLTSAVIAWQQAAPLFHAAARPGLVGIPTFVPATDAGPDHSGDAQPVLDAQDLIFRYENHAAPVLRRCSLRICQGDRLLLEGASGSGKSTLVSLITGLRTPESGLILLGGLDRQTLGSEVWRQRVAAAPQFHENHVLTETFGFNLLMGHRWPPRTEDLEDAEAVCRELGLGELLDRMPGGLLQMVGETGWQLSHGEQSRLYIARALLQGSDLLVLDESFGALDPENLQRALHCVLNRTSTLLVIAQP